MAPLTSYLVETLLTLFGVLALAVLALYAARRVGVGRALGPMELLGRLPLEGRRAVYLLKIGDVVYVIGSSEAGLSKLGELQMNQLPSPPDEPPAKPFAQLVKDKLVGRGFGMAEPKTGAGRGTST